MADDGSPPVQVEFEIGFDDVGNAVVRITINGGRPAAVTAESAEDMAVQLMQAAATAKCHGAMYRDLTLRGWDGDSAREFIISTAG